MASTRRRIGVIGTGFGAQVHVPAFQSEGWEVAALCGRDRDKTAQAARAAGVAEAHTDPLALIARDDLDAVAISSPPATHHPLAVAALGAGKHVLCEKPFALDAAQGRQMCEAALHSGRTAMVAHEFRHSPQRAFIKQLLADGYVGTFRLCTIELFLDRYVTAQPRPLTWLARQAEGGGILGALGSHYIDALRDWFGEVTTASGQLAILRPDLVDPRTGQPARAETDDTFLFTLGFAGGGIATMTASFAATPARAARIAVMGDRGTLLAEQPGPNPVEDGVVIGSRDGSELLPLATPARYAPEKDGRDPRLSAFRLLVRDFDRGIEQGTSPAPSFTDGLRCQEVLDAIRESSQSGRSIRLP